MKRKVALGLGVVALVWLFWFLLFPPVGPFLPDGWRDMSEENPIKWVQHRVHVMDNGLVDLGLGSHPRPGGGSGIWRAIYRVRGKREASTLRREFGHYLEGKAP